MKSKYLLLQSQRSVSFEAPCNKLFFYGDELLGLYPNYQGGLPLIGCSQLLIQYICSYPPYMEAISSIHNPRKHHAVVTGTPHIIGFKIYNEK